MDPTLEIDIDNNYTLSEAEVHVVKEGGNDKVLGESSTATLLEIEYMGLKCAGKKLLDWTTKKATPEEIFSPFKEECRILSQLRHPNIVQFLGLYCHKRERAPIIVMEYLPTNLTTCIERHGILPKEIGYSILHDVALGLRYLHNQTTPIVHRNLNSNNILLTSSMTAKITDLGMARILKNVQATNPWTQDPVNILFMPPEAQTSNPIYNASTDVFSYGILMIHVLSGRCPEPQTPPIVSVNDSLVPVTEEERRSIFLEVIGNDHPLMGIIRRCINHVKANRPEAHDIEKELHHLSASFPFTADQINVLIQKFKEPKSSNGQQQLSLEELELGKERVANMPV